MATNLSTLGGTFKGNEADARNYLRGQGLQEPSQGLVKWLAYGSQEYGPGEAAQWGLPGGEVAGFGGGTNISDIIAGQKTEEQKLLDEYKAKIIGQEPLPAAYERLSTQAGIPGYQQTLGTFQTSVANVKNLLDRLEEGVNERTSGTLTTEAQRLRLLAAESQPLQTELGRLGEAMTPVTQALSTAMGNVQTGLGLLTQQQARELQPTEMAMSLFSDRAAREVTGYTTDKQAQLQVYLAKLTNNQALTVQQMKDASELAKLEKEYSLKSEQLKTLSKYGVYNPLTGEIVGATTGGTTPTPSFTPSGAYNIQNLWG